MTFLDLNCMWVSNSAKREPSFQTVQELLGELDRIGIDTALVYASGTRYAPPADDNACLLSHAVMPWQKQRRSH